MVVLERERGSGDNTHTHTHTHTQGSVGKRPATHDLALHSLELPGLDPRSGRLLVVRNVLRKRRLVDLGQGTKHVFECILVHFMAVPFVSQSADDA